MKSIIQLTDDPQKSLKTNNIITSTTKIPKSSHMLIQPGLSESLLPLIPPLLRWSFPKVGNDWVLLNLKIIRFIHIHIKCQVIPSSWSSYFSPSSSRRPSPYESWSTSPWTTITNSCSLYHNSCSTCPAHSLTPRTNKSSCSRCSCSRKWPPTTPSSSPCRATTSHSSSPSSPMTTYPSLHAARGP
jgi:hypothetical protein